MKFVPRNYVCKNCGRKTYEFYEKCLDCKGELTLEPINQDDKNAVIKGRIEKYFVMLKHQKREVDENTLCELIQQWAFDFRMEKDLHRFD
jgi:predicted ATP-dependent serine protease